MTMSFYSAGDGAELLKIDPKKEGNSEDRKVILELKFELETSANVLTFLLGSDLNDHLCFWRDDMDRNAAFVGIEKIECWASFKGQNLRFGHLKFSEIETKKYSFKPVGKGLVVLNFIAVIHSPTEEDLSAIPEMLLENHRLSLESHPDLFAASQQKKSKASKKQSAEVQLEVYLEEPIEEEDPLYNEAVKAVIDSGRCSISFVQRSLRIGYNRAARMVEEMEKRGVVSGIDTNGTRYVFQINSETIESVTEECFPEEPVEPETSDSFSDFMEGLADEGAD